MTIEKDMDSNGTSVRSPLVKLPKELLSGNVIVIISVIAAILLFFVLNNIRKDDNERNLLSSSRTNSISSPAELILPTRGIENPILQQPSATLPDSSISPLPRPTPSIPNDSSVSPIQRNISSPPVAQNPQIQNTPLPELFRPSSQENNIAPFNQFSRLPKALVLDRGIRRISTTEKLLNTGDENNEFTPIRPQAANRSPNLLAAGTLIPAVLETSLDTSKNGLARAMVTKNMTSFDNSNVLIPRGSRLIGQYASEGTPTQNRILVNWNRLVLPDGRQVKIDAPAADKNGAPGIRGKVRSNAVGRFFTSFLQTALNIATFRAINSGNGDSILVTVPGGVTGTTQELIPQQQLRRKITVPAGAELTVFVSKDIDFTVIENQ